MPPTYKKWFNFLSARQATGCEPLTPLAPFHAETVFSIWDHLERRGTQFLWPRHTSTTLNTISWIQLPPLSMDLCVSYIPFVRRSTDILWPDLLRGAKLPTADVHQSRLRCGHDLFLRSYEKKMPGSWPLLQKLQLERFVGSSSSYSIPVGWGWVDTKTDLRDRL